MPPGVSGATNKSERYASNKLNLPRGQRRRHSAERKVSHISVDRPEVGVVEEVEEFEAQLQIAGFAEPGKMSILGEARIHVNHSGIAIAVAWHISFRARRGSRKIRRSKQAIFVRAPTIETLQPNAGLFRMS
jgi:hypothetical protein